MYTWESITVLLHLNQKLCTTLLPITKTQHSSCYGIYCYFCAPVCINCPLVAGFRESRVTSISRTDTRLDHHVRSNIFLPTKWEGEGGIYDALNYPIIPGPAFQKAVMSLVSRSKLVSCFPYHCCAYS